MTEALYYRAYYSFLMQQPGFRTDFEILLDQYGQFPDTFRQFSKLEVLRIKQMQDSYTTGRITLFNGALEYPSNAVPDISLKSDKAHKELCITIAKNKATTLEPHTGPIKDMCLEYPVMYGSIDIMALSGSCAYIIEVKTETADHDIIGQVMKYFIGLSAKLILKFFNEVRMITIAPGYKPSAFNGLHQIGAVTLLMDKAGENVSRP